MDTSQVVKCIFEENGYRVSVVMDGEELYTLLTFEDWNDISRFLPMFNDLDKRAGFTDFVGCFVGEARNTAVYVVFKYYEEDRSGLPGIGIKTSGKALQIFENILKRLIVLNPPDFLTDVMITNLCAYDDGRVEFNYFLTDFGSIVDGLKAGQAKLAAIFYEIFKMYIKPDNALSLFFKRLQHGGFDDFFSVYEEFKSVTEDFTHYEPRKLIDVKALKEKAARLLSLSPKSKKDYVAFGSRYVYNKLFLVLLLFAAGAVFAAVKAFLGG